ncbi:MAG: GNAT family N-acetyltransferase [Acidimicrobiia bacterium]|nr:GNAT family N-acetyltransferase [Acidimicrobiia bacterium]MYC58471.1 GNAT family N-acetyltransferase [Acidimicrobiia bacterium]MYG94229.1 GNAT family N-acetyltransferase [Acidimicrobiia bacterium]MYI30423.1 GNAT family N-acetyltransferase [Acidimicrobiia bacterium]
MTSQPASSKQALQKRRQLEKARLACSNDVSSLVTLAREARQEMLQYRGGKRWLDTEAQQEPLEDFFKQVLAGTPSTLSFNSSLQMLAVGVFVGIWENAVVGYGWISTQQRHNGNLLARINELYVTPDARSVGVGESLFKALRTWALSEGAQAIEGWVLPGHREAKNFFETFKMTAHALTVYSELTSLPQKQAPQQ